MVMYKLEETTINGKLPYLAAQKKNRLRSNYLTNIVSSVIHTELKYSEDVY